MSMYRPVSSFERTASTTLATCAFSAQQRAGVMGERQAFFEDIDTGSGMRPSRPCCRGIYPRPGGDRPDAGPGS